MKLINELTEDKAASFALSWSISWRFFVTFILIGTVFQFVSPAEFQFEYAILSAIGSVGVSLVFFWLWVHRLLKKGIGNVRIIFMEKQHYEELVKKDQYEN